jgi:hypothetical protein
MGTNGVLRKAKDGRGPSMRRQVIWCAAAGFVIPLFWGFVSFIFFGAKQSVWADVYWLLVYVTCPFWLLPESLPQIWTPVLNAVLYGGLAALICTVLSAQKKGKFLIVCITSAAIVALSTIYIANYFPALGHGGALLLDGLLRLVPSAGRISVSTGDREAGEVILLAQWMFFPVYLFAWFYAFPPWDRSKQAARLGSRTLTDARRQILNLFGLLVLIAWILGDAGLIGFPTFYNGKFVYPVTNAVIHASFIYTSQVALAVYAWFGPIAEATVIWALSHLAMNAKTFVSLSHA